MMTLGSLFDGLGGWQIAACRAGVKPVWSSDDRCIYLMLKHLSSQFLIRTRKYSNNETALDKFYDEYEQEVENETR